MSLINTKIIRQGLMKKAPSAKKRDEVRKGTWQERWFVLKKTTLFYYKKRGDTRAKGEIDLRAAIIEDADVKTRKEFTIRIHQASQVFNYLQCSSQSEKEAWLEDIRAAAGYKEAKVEEQVHANEYFASFGVLKQGLDGNLRRVVLIPDEKRNLVHVAFEQQFVKRYTTNVVRRAKCSKEPTVSSFYEVRLVICPDPRLPQEVKEKIFYVATKDEAVSCSTLLNNFCQGDRVKIQDLSRSIPKQKGFLEMQGLADKAWVRLWAVLVEKRCLLYNSVDDTIPVWIVWISGTPQKEGRGGLSYKDPHQQWNFRFEDSVERDAWAVAFAEISRSFEQALTDKLENLEFDKTEEDIKPVFSSQHITMTKQIAESLSTYVVTWGLGKHGQLGNGTSQSTSFPVLTRLLSDKKVRNISVGQEFGVAVTRQGACYSWGTGKNGELGLGESALKKNYPCLVVSLRSTSIAQVACGSHHVLGQTGNGQIFSWGCNDKGQLGHGGTSNQYKPKIISFFRDLDPTQEMPGTMVIQIAASGSHSLALQENGCAVYSWGYNKKGQLGQGAAAGEMLLKPKAIQMFSGPDRRITISVLAAGKSNSAFLANSGELFICGDNENGQLGMGDTSTRLSPTLLESKSFGNVTTLSQVTQVALGAKHTLAVVGNQLFGWGAAGLNGHKKASNVPGKPLGDCKLIACSGSHSAIVNGQFQVETFGTNDFGQLGVDENLEVKGMAKANLAEDLACLSIVCGEKFCCALMEGKRPQKLHRELKQDRAAVEEFANKEAAALLSKLNSGAKKPAPEVETASNIPQRSNPELKSMEPARKPVPVVKKEEPKPQPKPQSKPQAKPDKSKGVWKEVVDPRSKKPYYYHTLTRETRWKKPTDGLPIVKKHMPSK